MSETVSEPDTKPATPEAPPRESLDKLVLKIKAKRWLTYRRYLDMTTDELMADSFCLLVVAANEQGRTETVDARHPSGRDQIERFMEMTLTELSDYVGLTDPKSDPREPGATDGVPGSGDETEPPGVAAE